MDPKTPATGEQAEAVPGATSQAAPAAAAAAPAAPSEPVDFTATMDAITEATMTGNTKEATRLQAQLDEAQKQPPAKAAATPPAKSAKAAPAAAPAAATVTTDEDDQTAAEDPERSEVGGQRSDDDSDAGDDTGDVNAGDDGNGEGADTQTGDQPPEGEADPEPKKPAERVRINHLSEPDKARQLAIINLTKGGMALDEAYERVMGDPGRRSASAEAPDNDAAPAAPEPAQPSAAITELDAKVKDLKSRLKAAGATEGLFNEEIADLTAELSEAHAELSTAKLAEKQNASQNAREKASFDEQRTQSWNASVEKFPALADPKSELFALSRDLALAAQNPTHPDHKKSWDVNAPDYFSGKAAKTLKIAPVTKPGANGKPAAPAKAALPNTQQQQAAPATRPAPGSKGTATVAVPRAATAAELEAETTAILEGRAPAKKSGTVMRGGVLVR